MAEVRGGHVVANDRFGVTRNTNRDATVAIKVRVFVNDIVDSLLSNSKQYFP